MSHIRCRAADSLRTAHKEGAAIPTFDEFLAAVVADGEGRSKRQAEEYEQ